MSDARQLGPRWSLLVSLKLSAFLELWPQLCSRGSRAMSLLLVALVSYRSRATCPSESMARGSVVN